MRPRTHRTIGSLSRIFYEHRRVPERAPVSKPDNRRHKSTFASYNSLERKGCNYGIVSKNNAHLLDFRILFAFSILPSQEANGLVR